MPWVPGVTTGTEMADDFNAIKTKVDGVAPGATANAPDAALRDRGTHTGTQPASTISNFAEAVDDQVAGLLVGGLNISITYDDVLGTLTIDTIGGGGGATDLSYDAPTRTLASSTGDDVVLPLADGANAGLLSSAGFTALSTALQPGALIPWTDISGKPATFAPSAHGHTAGEITGLAAVATSGSAADLGSGILPAARFNDTAHGNRAGGALHADAVAAGASGFMSGADKTKLNGIATGATANSSDATLLARANHTGTQLASTISDFAATVRATVLTGFAAAGTRTAIVAGDTILAAFGKVQKYLNDLSALAFSGAASDLTGTKTSTFISDFSEATDDRVASLLVAGTNITLTYDDILNTLTIAAAGGGAGTDLSYTAATRLLISSTGTDVTLPLVVAAGDAGLMTGADKTKLDGIASGAQVNVATDLSYTPSTRLLLSSTGADVTLPLATGTDAGLMASGDFTKLAGIATGATANSPDATLLARANHTGTQLASTISDFAATVIATVLTGFTVAGSRTAVVATDTILAAFGKVQKYLNDLAAVAFSGSASDLSAGTLPAARFDDTAHGNRGGGSLHPAVIAAGASGFMTGADKTKLDGIAAGAQVNVATDLSYTASTRVLASSTGVDATLPLADGTNPGLMASADFTKLAATPKITVSTSAPGSPAVGDLWVDTN